MICLFSSSSNRCSVWLIPHSFAPYRWYAYFIMNGVRCAYEKCGQRRCHGLIAHSSLMQHIAPYQQWLLATMNGRLADSVSMDELLLMHCTHTTLFCIINYAPHFFRIVYFLSEHKLNITPKMDNEMSKSMDTTVTRPMFHCWLQVK